MNILTEAVSANGVFEIKVQGVGHLTKQPDDNGPLRTMDGFDVSTVSEHDIFITTSLLDVPNQQRDNNCEVLHLHSVSALDPIKRAYADHYDRTKQGNQDMMKCTEDADCDKKGEHERNHGIYNGRCGENGRCQVSVFMIHCTVCIPIRIIHCVLHQGWCPLKSSPLGPRGFWAIQPGIPFLVMNVR